LGRKISKKEKVSIHLSSVEQLLATGLFIGHVPFAPATWSCAISFLIWYFVRSIPWLYVVITCGLFIAGVFISRRFEKAYGDDPHCVVIDEYTCFLLPLFFTPRRVIPFVVSFILFRIFDIVKPPPLRQLEKMKGGWGIMLDDVGAALYTTVVALVIFYLFSL
jgi:phosphatidylglycerophosphatase A